MIVFSIARIVHIVAGCVALASFAVPLVAKKGGALHRRAGCVYVSATAVIAVTGVLNCAAWLTDAKPKNDAFALFLLYIALIAASSTYHGVRALRTKGRTAKLGQLRDLVLPTLLLLGGVALGAFGLARGAALFVAFAALGVFLGAGELRFWLRAPQTRHEWFFAHMSGMGASCITTLTAFVVINAGRLGLGTWSLAAWITPGLVGGVGLAVWKRYYRRRMGGAKRAGYEGAPIDATPAV